jgi:hypothetical protein
MNSTTDVEKLRSIIGLCRSVGIEVVVFQDNKVLGANEARNLAIISEHDIPLAASMGIGRVSELDKRLAMFDSPVAEVKVTDRGEVAILTLKSGKMKAQFRCTSLTMLERRYPKTNEDPAFAAITLPKIEVAQFSRAVKTFGSAKVVLKIDRSGLVRLECNDSVNDLFTLDLEHPASFLGEEEGAVFSYSAGNFTQVIDLGAKEQDEVTMVMGESGSLTTLVRGHTLVIAPNVNEE